MSRSANRDNSTAVTLFPFLAVLLCTMGSLVMILVVVAKVSRDKAIERAEAEKAARAVQAPVEASENAVRQLKLAKERLIQLDRAKLAAEKTLRDDQLRLQHIEDHMRRLEEQLEALQLAAAELDAMEQDHLDDRMQATREVARLQQLIDDTREQIVELEAEQEDGPRSYSIIPYKGPHGTARQPIYIECLKDEVVLQPEGIRLKPQDFMPPLGAGNPLASALRAAREFMVTRHPELSDSVGAEPYPLILVRPDGIGAYYRVREAIESWDSDFGYELVDADWELEFPDSNPELATLEARAVESARRRQRMLMAAAPNAYGRGNRGLAGGSFEMESHDGGGSFEDGSMSLGASDEFGAGGATQRASAERFVGMGQASTDLNGTSDAENANGEGYGGGKGESQTATDGSETGEEGDSYASESGGPQLYPATEAGQNPQSNTAQQRGNPAGDQNLASLGTIPNRQAKKEKASQGKPGSEASNEGGQPSSGGASGASASLSSTAGGAASGSPSPGGGQDSSGSSSSASLSFSSSGRSGSSGGSQPFTGSNPNDVPVRRAVQIVVRHDRVAILPARTGNTRARVTLTGGKVILLEGDTSLAVDQIISELQAHVRNWGIAGRGHFWRPVLMLNVGPDGNARAEELTALLKKSGLELRNTATAKHSEPGNANTTR